MKNGDVQLCYKGDCLLRRAGRQKVTDVSEVPAASMIIALMMEAARTYGTSLNFYHTTRDNISEVSHTRFAAVSTCNRANYIVVSQRLVFPLQ
jgi:hypothetical protein